MTEDFQTEHQRLKTHDSIMTERVLELERMVDDLRRAQKAPAWIPCAQQLPDDDTTVLIAMEDGEVWTGFHADDRWFFVSADPVGSQVTHWAEFPEPPK